MNGLDFEKPIIELERKIEELRNFTSDKKIDIKAEINKLEEKLKKLKKEIYSNLSAWQRVQIARHPKRPYSADYIQMILTDFLELHGDRAFADDLAIIGGLAKLEGRKIVVIGHQKGRDTKENILRNFGCAHPEGYRKSIRLMELAEDFKLPILTFIDTPGAYPGIGAEERGQAVAIAYNLRRMISLAVPIVVVVIGEGGSGGALGISVGDKICVMENAYYSVISPEGCAAILWKDSSKAPLASETLKMTAKDLLDFGIIDEVISEPLGGAHRDPHKAGNEMKSTIIRLFDELDSKSIDKILQARYEKFRSIGRIQSS
ncbi:MAG: acetyl-CoA carboxylase carboxyltransferase subunit alpha [Candidatus Omnitrophica bacterium]|nr:acetyl-CoA carboxylase carboxyltransferase subunit alpha [Candidatus Omnitrophota bacterium]